MAENGSAIPQESAQFQDKGKGKSVDTVAKPDIDDDEEDEEESGADEVNFSFHGLLEYQTNFMTGSRR